MADSNCSDRLFNLSFKIFVALVFYHLQLLIRRIDFLLFAQVVQVALGLSVNLFQLLKSLFDCWIRLVLVALNQKNDFFKHAHFQNH